MNDLASNEISMISRDEARGTLEPHFPVLRQVLRDAWEEWERVPVEQRSKLNARARANCLYDFIVHYAKLHFADVPGVIPFERRGLFLLGFSGRLTIRFKKLGAGNRASNIQTKQQVDFNLQIDLPGIPRAFRLTVGYVLDAMQTSIKDVLVTHQTGRRVEWGIPIAQTHPTILEMPMADATLERKVKVRVKKETQQMKA
jgi:hypothetical protein